MQRYNKKCSQANFGCIVEMRGNKLPQKRMILVQGVEICGNVWQWLFVAVGCEVPLLETQSEMIVEQVIEVACTYVARVKVSERFVGADGTDKFGCTDRSAAELILHLLCFAFCYGFTGYAAEKIGSIFADLRLNLRTIQLLGLFGYAMLQPEHLLRAAFIAQILKTLFVHAGSNQLLFVPADCCL